MFQIILLGLFAPTVFAGEGWTGWENNWDAHMFWESSTKGRAIAGFQSYHDNGKEDRRWRIFWRDMPSTPSSHGSWSGWHNNFDDHQSRTGDNYVFTGIQSYHSNNYEDRRWSIKRVGSNTNNYVSSCGWLGWTNWDSAFTKTCSGGKYMSGMLSYHNNGKEDRRFNFRCCTLKSKTKSPTKKPTKRPTTKRPTTKRPTTKRPTTKRPTTKRPTTKRPTKKPTGSPTKNPKTCSQLNWGALQKTYGHPYICGESDGGGLGCSGLMTYSQAQEHCESRGARMCTSNEIANDEARGTGCSYDNHRIWSSTSCGNGKFHTLAGASTTASSNPLQCTSSGTKLYARCCADEPYDDCEVDEAEHRPEGFKSMKSKSAGKGGKTVDVSDISLKNRACSKSQLRRKRKEIIKASIAEAGDEVEVAIEDLAMPANFVTKAQARGKSKMKARRAKAKTKSSTASGEQQCSEADIDLAEEGAYDVDMDDGETALACRGHKRPITKLTKVSGTSYKKRCFVNGAWGPETSAQEGDEYVCDGQTFFVESLATVATGETDQPTAAPTSAPTTGTFYANQMSQEDLNGTPWMTGVVGETMYKCSDFDGCYMNEAADRSRWVRTTHPGAQHVNQAKFIRTVSDGEFRSYPNGISFIDGATGQNIFAPYTCQCN